MTSGKRRKRPYAAPSATPWDGLPAGELTPAEKIVRACHKDIYRYRHAPVCLEGEADFFNGYERDACPRCGSSRIKRSGFDSRGVRRWLCHGCGRTFTPMTGTIFEDHRITVADWTEFIIEALSYESVHGMTRANRRSVTTLPYWMAKLFLVLEGVQDDVVLSGRVEIDEMGYLLASKDRPKRPDGSELPGAYSRNRICIGIGCDGHGHSYFAREGLGKTSGAKTLAAFGEHIKKGSHLVHDMENGHNALVRELSLGSEAHSSRLMLKMPDKEKPLRNVNHLCDLLRQFLDAHSGFDRDDIDGYLNLFWVAMNPPKSKLEKAAFVLDRAMGNPKSLRYREFYKKKPRSGDGGPQETATLCKE